MCLSNLLCLGEVDFYLWLGCGNWGRGNVLAGSYRKRTYGYYCDKGSRREDGEYVPGGDEATEGRPNCVTHIHGEVGEGHHSPSHLALGGVGENAEREGEDAGANPVDGSPEEGERAQIIRQRGQGP